METRKLKERKFHNELRNDVDWQRWSKEEEDRYGSNPSWSNMKFYSIERASRGFVENWLRERCPEKKALDCCCGSGEDSMFMAGNGATVFGIDISDVSIKNCIRKAELNGFGKNPRFQIMDAEMLAFKDDYFDLVNIYGVLHHLDLQKALAGLSRVLKQGGAVICTEALKYNPLIHLYRRKTPHLRTRWEVGHILGKEELKTARRYFDKVEMRFFHLATLMAVPLRRTPIFNPILRFLERVDRALLRLPFLKWMAWQVVFVLSQPKKRTD